jgi:hypothetical protein
VLRELLARFGIEFDDAQLQKGNQSVNNLAKNLRTFAGVAAAVAVGRGLASFIDKIRETADELDKTSIQLGLSTEELQGWRFAANLAGVDGAAFSQSLGLLQRNAFEASRGSAQMVDSFRRLGVEVRDSNGQLKDGNTLLEDVADGLANTENESERVALSLSIMGRSGRKLLPLFTQGAEGVRRAREEFEELGGGISQDVIDQSVELTDEMTRFDTAMDGVRSNIALALLPAMNRFVTFMKDGAAAVGDLIEGTNVVEIVFVALGAAAVALAIKMVAAFAVPIAIFVGIVVIIGVLILFVDDLITLFQGGDSVIGEFIDTLFGIGTAQALVQDLTDAWNGLLLTVKEVSNAVADFFGLEQPFENPREGIGGGVAANTPEAAGRAQRRQAALQGNLRRSRDTGPQDIEGLLKEANEFRREARLETELVVGSEGRIEERRLPRQALRQIRQEQRQLADNPPQQVLQAAQAVGQRASQINQNQANTFNLTGQSPQEAAQQVRQILTRVNAEQNKAALAALVPEGEPDG